jgi:hypothetical protein
VLVRRVLEAHGHRPLAGVGKAPPPACTETLSRCAILAAWLTTLPRDRAIYHALKAAGEVAAALQTHLIEEHGADPERAAPQSPSSNSLKLLRQAREHLGKDCEPLRQTISLSPTRSLRATDNPGSQTS